MASAFVSVGVHEIADTRSRGSYRCSVIRLQTSPESILESLLSRRLRNFRSHETCLRKHCYHIERGGTDGNKSLPRFYRRPLWLPPLLLHQLLLDQNDWSEESIDFVEISPDENWIAFTLSQDQSVGYSFDIAYRRLDQDKICRIDRECSSYTWEADSSHILYTAYAEEQTCFAIYRHTLSTPSESDRMVYLAPKNKQLSVFPSESNSLVFVREECEERYVHLLIEPGKSQVIEVAGGSRNDERFSGIQLHSMNGNLVIHKGQSDLYKAKLSSPREWSLLYSTESSLERIIQVQTFRKFLVLYIRRGPDPIVRVIREDGTFQDLKVAEECYSLHVLPNPDVETDFFQTSLKKHTVHYEPILGYYDRIKRKTKRAWVRSSLDQTPIPVSMVLPKPMDLGPGQASPAGCVLMAYGAYDVTCEPEFSVPVLFLLEQNIAFAIAHVRGGGEFPPCSDKNQSVQDLLDVASFLRSSLPCPLAGWGSSAGAAILGSAIKQEPQIFQSVALVAPFLDVIAELDRPETPESEFEEWFDLRTPSGMSEAIRFNPMDVPDNPPCFPALMLLAYEQDEEAPVEQVQRYAESVRKSARDADVRVEVIPNADHSGPPDALEKTKVTAKLLSFLIETLGDQPKK